MKPRETGLREALDRLVRDCGPESLRTDPLRFPHRFGNRDDREAAALVAAVFAYGNVTSMGAFLEGLFARLSPRPAEALRRGVPPGSGPYRFQTGADVDRFLAGLGRVLRAHRTLEDLFGSGGSDAERSLEHLCAELRRSCSPLTRGLEHLLPLPSSGSACKRWWLFLRWVCRPRDGLDLGLWTRVPPSLLRLPVDTHVARIALSLGLSRRKSPDRLFAIEATESLRQLCPEDPVRYDYALARLGIAGDCPMAGRGRPCGPCPLKPFCLGKGGV